MVRNPLTPAQIAAGQRVGHELRQARAERTLAEVAAAAGMSPETLRKIETGRLPTPSFGTVALLCRVLDLDISDLADLWVDAPEVVRAASSSTARVA